jgi:tRNA-dihydrouridine synthase 2
LTVKVTTRLWLPANLVRIGVASSALAANRTGFVHLRDMATTAKSFIDAPATHTRRPEAVQDESIAAKKRLKRDEDGIGYREEAKDCVRESSTQCAETGDMPLPNHPTDDLEDVKKLLVEGRAHLSANRNSQAHNRHLFRRGLFLAPMVRIGSLPTRLLSLQYGADLVWSPEIVDRAIIGCDRTVNQETGLIAYSREGKHIFTTHPIERDRLIFQLGSSSPEWAYKAIKFITMEDDVAGVDLNCGCPKSFSTIGGMGAQLLSTPELLCDILRAMRLAAPPHVSVTCKIRLLPTKEETQALVRMIIDTGCIDALTVHCRTKTMRPREPALPHRLKEVKDVLDQMTEGRLPLIVNGDAWDYAEAQKLMETTCVDAVMMARGPEGNPSCFRKEGVLDVADIVGPAWARFAVAFENQYGNTKYCLQSMAIKPSSSVVPNAPPLQSKNKTNWTKAKLVELRSSISRAKSVEEMAVLYGIDVEETRRTPVAELLREVKKGLEKKEESVRVKD